MRIEAKRAVHGYPFIAFCTRLGAAAAGLLTCALGSPGRPLMIDRRTGKVSAR